jgi:enoyl-CoA hydratase/carnithine racemase
MKENTLSAGTGGKQAYLDDCVYLVRLTTDIYEILDSVKESERRMRWLEVREKNENIKAIILLNEKGVYSESFYRKYQNAVSEEISRVQDIDEEMRSHTRRTRELHLLQRFILHRVRSSKIYIDCLQGEIITPWIGASLASDLRFISEDTRFVFSHLRRGKYIGGGLPFFLQRHTGASKAFQILLEKDEINSEEALRLGLVNKILPADDFETACVREAKKLCNADVHSLEIMKHMFSPSVDELERIFREETAIVEQFVRR